MAGFLLWPAAASILLLRRGAWGLVGFGLLWPWLLYLTEFATVRSQEAFVLYRLYPWIAGPCLVAGVGIVRLARRVAPATAAVIVAGLCAIAYGRIATFATAYRVWDDAVQKNRGGEASALAAFRPYLNRGVLSLAAGRTDDALADFTRAIELAPAVPAAHFNAAAALERLGRDEAALAEMNIGLARPDRLHPVFRARAYANRAVILLALRRPKDALADLERAAKLDPDEADYRDNLERVRALARD